MRYDTARGATLGLRFGSLAIRVDEDRCRELAERVPAFEVTLGRDAYADVSSASRVLEAVGRPNGGR